MKKLCKSIKGSDCGEQTSEEQKKVEEPITLRKLTVREVLAYIGQRREKLNLARNFIGLFIPQAIAVSEKNLKSFNISEFRIVRFRRSEFRTV
jgi:hypothetical protein